MRIYTCAPTPPVPRPAWASAAGSRATTPPGPIRHSAIGRPMRSTNHRRSRGLLRHRSVWQHDRHYSPQGDRPELRSLSRLSKLGGPAHRFTPEGPEILEEEWRTCLEQLTMLDFDYLVASGSLPRGVPEDFYRNVAKVASTKGAKFVLDTSGPALKAALGFGIHLAKPSRGELESLTGQDLKDPDALVSAAQDLVVSGTIEHL